jgi:hypothetical protein
MKKVRVLLSGMLILTLVLSMWSSVLVINPVWASAPALTAVDDEGAVTIEAEDFNFKQGMNVYETLNVDGSKTGGKHLGNIYNENYGVYHDVDFGTKTDSMDLRISTTSGAVAGGEIELWLDAPTEAEGGTRISYNVVADALGAETVSTLEGFPIGFRIYHTITVPLTEASANGVYGTHNLVVKFTRNDGRTNPIVDFDWLRFTPQQPQYEDAAVHIEGENWDEKNASSVFRMMSLVNTGN